MDLKHEQTQTTEPGRETPSSTSPMVEAKPTKRRFGRWGKRLGVAGFCFFFFKGLLWLIIPAWIVIERGCTGP